MELTVVLEQNLEPSLKSSLGPPTSLGPPMGQSRLPGAGPGVVEATGDVGIDHDAQLMLRVRGGDEASFGLLLEKHRRPVVHFLYRMVQNPAVSEELAQEVFLRVYRSRESYERSAKFTT